MAFGKYRHSNIRGDKGSNWNIEIWKDAFTGSSEEFSTSGDGFSITWSGAGGKRTPTFLGSQLTLNFLIKDNTDEAFVYNVLEGGFQTYYIRIYKGEVLDANIWWFGWIQPSFDTIQNLSFPYSYNLIATDSFGYMNQLKPLSFVDENQKRNSSNSIIVHLLGVFHEGGASKLNIGGSTSDNLVPAPDNYEWLRTSANWWREGDELLYDTVNPLSLYSVSSGGFSSVTKYTEDGELIPGGDPLQFKIQDVFNGVCKIIGLRGFLAEGRYNFIQPNLLQNNNTGLLKTYNYAKFLGGSTIDNINTILSIDQVNNNLLGGATFTYEPPLESVSMSYTQGMSTFEISPGTNIETTAFPVGYLIANSGMFKFTFIVHNYINVLKNDFSFSSNHDVFSNSYTNTCVLEVKLSNGVDDYYLQTAGDDSLEWVLSNSTPLNMTIIRGLGVPFYEPLNDSSSGMSTYDTSNDPQWNSSDNYPCKRTQYVSAASTFSYEFRTLVRFIADVEPAPISGSVTLKTTTTNSYKQREMNSADFNSSINTPTPTTNRTDVIALQYTPLDDNEVNNTPQEVEFRATQTEVLALDTEDLGSLPIGQRMTGTDTLSVVADKLYSIQYTDTGFEIDLQPAIQGFRNGNTGGYAPLMRLICEEYLTPQVKPLQILQANVKSADISPLKILKYSLNDDGNYEYYQFLGGTFKAYSEEMSGEWYKLESEPSFVTGETSSFIPIDSDPDNNITNQSTTAINNIQKRDLNIRSYDVYGVLDVEITAGIAYTKVDFSSNNLGKIYDNQKLRLSLPDGSNSITLVSSGDNLTTSDEVNVDSFTALITFPVGSILTPMITDLTNVIISSDNLALGVTSTRVYIKSDQFKAWTSSSIQSYSRDKLGSVQPSAYASRTKVFASTFIPAGYKITSFDVHSSQNRSIEGLTSRVINDSTSSIGTGSANTPVIATWTAVNGDYFIISYEIGASSDEIYGATLIIEKV